MQHEQNPLDQFLKEQVDNAHFDFDESYWEKASKMLDEQEQNDKKIAWWKRTGIVALFVTLILTIGYFITNKFDNKENQITQTPSSTQHSYEIDEKIPRENYDNNKDTTKFNYNTQNTDNHINNNNNSTNYLSNVENKTTSKQSRKNINNNNTNTELKDIYPPNEIDTNKKNDEKEERYSTEIVYEKTNKHKGIFAKNKKVENINRSNKHKEIAKLENQIKNEQELKNKVWVNNQWMTPIDTQILYSPTPIDPSISNPRLVPSLKDYVAHKNDSAIITYHFKKDTASVPIINNIEKDTALVSSKLSTLHLYLQLSAAINKGFVGNINTNKTWGISPVLSLGFGKQLNNRFCLLVQPGFTYFNAVNMEKKTRNYMYSFGIDSSNFVVSYKKMYQLQLPVGVQYSIFNKQSLLAMIGLSYILNVQNKVYDKGTTYSTTGYRDGINPLDIFIEMGYNYQINKKIQLQAAYYQGLKNLTQQEYFKTQNANKQKGIHISVRYNFIKK